MKYVVLCNDNEHRRHLMDKYRSDNRIIIYSTYSVHGEDTYTFVTKDDWRNIMSMEFHAMILHSSYDKENIVDLVFSRCRLP